MRRFGMTLNMRRIKAEEEWSRVVSSRKQVPGTTVYRIWLAMTDSVEKAEKAERDYMRAVMIAGRTPY